MRQKRTNQLSFSHIIPNTTIGRELAAISEILEDNLEILELAERDLVGLKRADTGRTGMTAEQVVRSTILKQYRSLTYEELAFHLGDSRAFRAFARLRMGQCPSSSTLQENIKSLSEETWEGINRIIVRYAKQQGLEKARKVRMDATAVESDIHYPLDSTLLQDGIRIISGCLAQAKKLRPVPMYRFRFSDHKRVTKKCVLKIQNAKNKESREKTYRKLLKIAQQVVDYALEAISVLQDFHSDDLKDMLVARGLADHLERAVLILNRVIDQTHRRVVCKQRVPASEKIVSIFECHTDIIRKGGRDTTYGHKVFLSGGVSGLIMDCVIERGNPSDSERFTSLLERLGGIYKKIPGQIAADGGFASRPNLEWAKQNGVRDMSFSKRKGLSVLEMVKSNWVYKRLKSFRAGIEANISTLKRAFGLTRSTWSGWAWFKQYVWSSVVSYNLGLLARLKLAQS